MTHALPRDADRQASLHMRGVDKSYGPLTVVDDVSMTVTTGSRIGVAGANGAGKTTLLRMLAGLEEPDAGTIARSPLTASIGYLPQELLCRAGETVRAYLDRRTGVVAAEAALDAAADLVATEPGSAEEYSRTLDHFLAAARFSDPGTQIATFLEWSPSVAGVPQATSKSVCERLWRPPGQAS